MREIQKADPHARRKALFLLSLGALFGAVVITLAELYGPAVTEWIARDPERIDSRLRIGGALVAFVLVVPLLGFTAYLWRLGARIVRTARFPAPGVAVARDTAVLHGADARHRGRAIQLLAAILAIAAAGLAATLWRLASALSAHPT